LEHFHQLEKYYQDTTKAALLLRRKVKESYEKFTDEQNLLTTRIAKLQEYTLMALATCQDMDRWYEKSHQAMERTDYISMVQHG
jgi:hypothetical protein